MANDTNRNERNDVSYQYDANHFRKVHFRLADLGRFLWSFHSIGAVVSNEVNRFEIL